MQRMAPLFVLGAILLCAGCASEVAPGKGSVRFDDGEPVRSGSIEFRAKSDGARYSSRIRPDGGFELADAEGQSGIEPGEYDVIVVQIVLTEDLALENHNHGHTVPRRYADYYTSDLRYTVAAGEVAPIEIVVGVN